MTLFRRVDLFSAQAVTASALYVQDCMYVPYFPDYKSQFFSQFGRGCDLYSGVTCV